MPFGEAVELASPMSEERRYVRTSLMPKMMECLSHNTAHKNENINLFEISAVYAQDAVQERVGIVMSGSLQNSKLHGFNVVSDFYSLKGVLEALLKQLGITSNRLSYKQNTMNTVDFHPYRSAGIYLGKDLLGIMGEVHPSLIKELGLPKGAVYAEIRLDLLMNVKSAEERTVRINKFDLWYFNKVKGIFRLIFEFILKLITLGWWQPNDDIDYTSVIEDQNIAQLEEVYSKQLTEQENVDLDEVLEYNEFIRKYHLGKVPVTLAVHDTSWGILNPLVELFRGKRHHFFTYTVDMFKEKE
jgi:hypothetical protein